MERRVTTQDIGWFLDLYRNQQLDISPAYQRKSVWSLKDRKYFLDTIFRGYPCPAIFLHKTLSSDGKQLYHVVDGKQRLETVFKFVNNEISIDKDFGDVNLDGKKWNDLDGSPELKKSFWDYVFSVEFIGTVEGTIINEVFARLNRNAQKLEPQEIRHARFSGWFASTIESEANKEEWVKLGVVTKARARRMKDLQFLSELLIVIIKKSIIGFDQDYIDGIYADYDSIADLSDFSEDDVFDEFESTKSFILEMQNSSPEINKYIKSMGHMYTLWSVVVMNRNKLSQADITAKKYITFMDQFAEIKEATTQEEFDKDNVSDPLFRYYLGSKGASTDGSKRSERYNALLNVLLD